LTWINTEVQLLVETLIHQHHNGNHSNSFH